jgi:hypothetical protein
MNISVSDSIYATVAYADIFDYPLTRDDIYLWCIKKSPYKNIRTTNIPGVDRNKYLFVLRGRKELVDSYDQRRMAAKEKWEIARRVGTWLQYIPTVFLVGVTGGLAVNNTDESDDIDLFFITAKNTIWISRLLVVIALDLLGIRRKHGNKNVANKICINMFMSEEAMSVPSNERDLYSAHEILQMVPLWSRRDTYWRFLQANTWVKNILPIAWNIKNTGHNQHPKISRWWTRLSRKILRIFETPAKYVQLWYMSSRRTNEIITDGLLKFHPHDARRWIIEELRHRLQKRNIPLDNIFYAS